jgi:hypothetical protein
MNNAAATAETFQATGVSRSGQGHILPAVESLHSCSPRGYVVELHNGAERIVYDEPCAACAAEVSS